MSNKSTTLLGFTFCLFALAPVQAQPSGARIAVEASPAGTPAQPATGFLPENLGKPAHRVGGATRHVPAEALGIPGARPGGKAPAAPRPAEPPSEGNRPAQDSGK